MGVKHFYIWLSNNFPEIIKSISLGQHAYGDLPEIDNLCLDMNGIFHPCAQKVFEYGEYAKIKRFGSSKKKVVTQKKRLSMFQEVTRTIDKIVFLMRPKKRLILCVDGVAGCAKMSQQRSRRFKGAKEMKGDGRSFDPNCMTPGTVFMNHLNKYIDWYVRKCISDGKWKFDVVFSDDKVPGEGEHIIINYIRKYSSPYESYCIYGLDADLIMLSLATHHKNMYIIRDDLRNKERYNLLDIDLLGQKLGRLLEWKGTKRFYTQKGIDDFIFLCFLVGNDFLPNIPTLAILESGIDIMIEKYKQAASKHGHLITTRQGQPRFSKITLKCLLEFISALEQGMLEDKLNKKCFFEDAILLSCATENEGTGFSVDMDKYIQTYHKKKLGLDKGVKKICHEYLRGLQWVITYYSVGIPDWKWQFKHHFAPFARDLVTYLPSFTFKKFDDTGPFDPFNQLLMVLPPESSSLLPYPLNQLLLDPKSPIIDFYPEDFKIDLSGKRREWEGIVILPHVDDEKVRQVYNEYKSKIHPRDLSRNTKRQSLYYSPLKNKMYSKVFRSYYGDILNHSVHIKILYI